MSNCMNEASICRPELSIACESSFKGTLVFFSRSQRQCWLLGWEEVEPLLALHAFLLVRIIWGESRWVCGHGWLVFGIMELESNPQESKVVRLITYLESVNTLSLCVQVVSQIHNRLCLIILITNKVTSVLLFISIKLQESGASVDMSSQAIFWLSPCIFRLRIVQSHECCS